MATIRRLSDNDVRAIFESVHNNRPPPPQLRYHIVPVGPEGLKLSPPSYEFEDGLYILLKPEKKAKKKSDASSPKVPSQLLPFLLRETPRSCCPWSLSGPQFPQPTAIQQRYCYPKGNPDYSSRKGGALWTMYGSDGKENLDYRLLHVYFSAKRAVNKGVTVPSAASTPCRTPVRKRAKPLSNPRKHHRKPSSHHVLRSPPHCLKQSSVPSFEVSGSCLPPMILSPPRVQFTGNLVTPPAGPNVFDRRFHPLIDDNNDDRQLSPFRPRILAQTPASRVPEDIRNQGSHVSYDSSSAATLDQFPWGEHDATLDELEEACAKDPFFPPSFASLKCKGEATDHRVKSFAARLDAVHESLKLQILAGKHVEQGPLVSLLSNWARQVAEAPLSTPSIADDAALQKASSSSMTTSNVQVTQV